MTNVMINKMINIINYIMTDIMMIHFMIHLMINIMIHIMIHIMIKIMIHLMTYIMTNIMTNIMVNVMTAWKKVHSHSGQLSFNLGSHDDNRLLFVETDRLVRWPFLEKVSGAGPLRWNLQESQMPNNPRYCICLKLGDMAKKWSWKNRPLENMYSNLCFPLLQFNDLLLA